MSIIAIVGNGPTDHLPDISLYKEEVDVWIGADGGVLTLINRHILPDYAMGDFDSIDDNQKEKIHKNAPHILTYPTEKNETDLELAINKAIQLNPSKVYLFGVTGGRLDHALINIHLLSQIIQHRIKGIIIDKWNYIELTNPGTHTVYQDDYYPYISFVPFSTPVSNLTLTHFKYPLSNYELHLGSSRCISNELIGTFGTFSYKAGNLLAIKSRDKE